MRIYPLSLAVDLNDFPYVEEDKVRYPYLADFVAPSKSDQSFDPEDWSDNLSSQEDSSFDGFDGFDDFEYDAE